MKKLGWVGTGVMGKSMCGHLMAAGYPMSVYTRTRTKAEELLAAGATWFASPKEVAENSDIAFAIVGYPQDVHEVFLGEEGLLAGAKRGAILVDMTTSEPSMAEEIYAAGKEKGVSVLDAPVSGGDVGAKEARLAIMAGGDKKAFDEVLPLFEVMGKNIRLLGGPGAGQHTKAANQIHIATTMIGLVECLLYAHRAGLDMMEVITTIEKGAAGTWSLSNYGPRIVKGNFDPGFMVKHFVKDMGIALKEARRMNLSLPGLAMAQQFYIAAMAEGLENMGTHSLYKVFERMNS
ncbi:MAG: NAD(P)-dependent oxidoreductase, partial [Spirochaetales bacterium]|nr:NAD(P)-dependent oxidoreductase [Spirochaetales bacterium]